MFRAGLDARVPTNDRQTLAMQNLGHAGVCRPLRLDGRLPSPGGELWRAAARVPREATGSRSPTGDRCGVRLASGSLGPLGNGSAGAPSGTGASGCRVRFPDGGAGPDHAGRSSDGWTARNFRRIRKGNTAGTNSGWPGSCAGEWEATGAAGNRSHPRCGDTETALCWHRQVRDCPPGTNRPHFGSPDLGN